MLKACKINKMNAWFDGFFGELILGLSETACLNIKVISDRFKLYNFMIAF